MSQHTHTHTLLTVAKVLSGRLFTRWSRGIMSWGTPKVSTIWYILFYIKASCKIFLLLHSIFTSYVKLYFIQLLDHPALSALCCSPDFWVGFYFIIYETTYSSARGILCPDLSTTHNLLLFKFLLRFNLPREYLPPICPI